MKIKKKKCSKNYTITIYIIEKSYRNNVQVGKKFVLNNFFSFFPPIFMTYDFYDFPLIWWKKLYVKTMKKIANTLQNYLKTIKRVRRTLQKCYIIFVPDDRGIIRMDSSGGGPRNAVWVRIRCSLVGSGGLSSGWTIQFVRGALEKLPESGKSGKTDLMAEIDFYFWTTDNAVCGGRNLQFASSLDALAGRAVFPAALFSPLLFSDQSIRWNTPFTFCVRTNITRDELKRPRRVRPKDQRRHSFKNEASRARCV